MTQSSSYRSKSFPQHWLLALLGSIVAVLGVARLLTPPAAREARVQVVQSAAPPSRPAPPSANLRPDGAWPARASIAGALASGHPVSTDEPAEAEPSSQDYIDRARAEARDDDWAGPMERLFEEDLRAKAEKHGFRVGNVECHTNTCEAELFWASLGDARADFKNVLAEPERSQCLPRLILTEGAHEDAPEMGVMLLHCKSQRQRAARRAGVVPVDEDEAM
jgi:hypothetical protein